MITTRPFALTKKQLLRILLARVLKRRGWILLIVISVAGFSMGMSNKEGFSYLPMLIFIIFYPALIVFSHWRFVNAKDNRSFFLSRHYEMDFDFIKWFVEEGSSSNINIDSFIKADLIARTWVLALSKGQAIYIPVTAFKSTEDLKWFETNIIGKIKTPGFL